MGIIRVKNDHNLVQSEIIVGLTNSSKDEMGNDYAGNNRELQQTNIYGIQAPLVMVNNIVVDFTDIISFNLRNKNVLPEVSLVAYDRKRMIASLDTPSIDNELRVQILPKFDGKYKKIDLTFYITSISYNKDVVSIKGLYKSPLLSSSHIKSFGRINTYNLFETIANETQMGFASNVESNDDDLRWIYCDNKSYLDIFHKEISHSGSELIIYDYWIDWWNNIVLADIYERYNATDKDEDLQIWIAGQNGEIIEGDKTEPMQVLALLNNHPMNMNSELFVSNYKITNNPGSQQHFGTDRLYSVYETDKTEYKDYLIQDGDTKNDIFTKYEYLGESYGEYNYLLSAKKRDTFLQKINSNETLDVCLSTPLLGIMRGNRVNFAWYVNDSQVSAQEEEFKNAGIINEVVPDIQIEEDKRRDEDGDFILDKSISGQYLITGCELKYLDHNWKYNLTLSRPISKKPKIIKQDE